MTKQSTSTNGYDINISAETVESIKKWSIRTFGVSILILLGYCSRDILTGDSSPSISPKTTIEDTANNSQLSEYLKNTPTEAKDFVEKYYSRYGANSVATYYSEKYLESYTHTNAIISDEDVKNYIPFEISGEEVPKISKHGFSNIEIQIKDKKLNEDEVINIINTQFFPAYSEYLNLLAKNPSQDKRKIIDDEFFRYYSSPYNKESTNNLKEFSKILVAKYGSNVNYVVNPISESLKDKDDYFKSYMTKSSMGSGEQNDMFGYGFVINRLSIGIDTYSNDKNDISKITLDKIFSFQLEMLQTKNGYVSVGLITNPDNIKIYE